MLPLVTAELKSLTSRTIFNSYFMKRKITFFMSLATCMSLNAQLIVATGSMSVKRTNHGSETLANGKILVFGGEKGATTGNLVYKSAELYNNGTWTSTGNMAINRSEPASVVLSNGNVLVIGGDNVDNDNYASCEIYNVATGTWSYADSLNYARSSAIAITLNNGKVLAIGGDNSQLTCELYDETTNTWTATGSMSEGAMSWFDAVKLPNGNVLKVGTGTTVAEIYNVATGTWSQVSNPMTSARTAPTAILMNNGKVLIAGGMNNLTSEVFDPATNTFTAVGNLGQKALSCDMINLADGRVLIFGSGDLFATSDRKALQVFNPSTGTWSYPGAVAGTIFPAQNYTVNQLSNGKILFSGGSFQVGDANTQCYIVNISPLGVEELVEEDLFSVYPVPATNQVTVTFDKANASNGYAFLLCNTLGQVISSVPVQSQSTSINLQNITESGVYFVSLKNNQDEIIQTRKIIIE